MNPIADEGFILVTLRSMPGLEAKLAAAKLESEGIPTFVAGDAINYAHAFIFPEVQLQVRKSDLQRATQVLAQPAALDDDGDYADEEFRCPQCHSKDVALMPPSKLQKFAKYSSIVTLG